ncbi:serine protease HTRA2, mitochondrial-like [Amphiura filiformis]|uniref:serine protease HTRA2, mitochondrial-like n=1 Tax=Amphiura filiformis TaxID=82378 RepID=UPI003B2157FB
MFRKYMVKWALLAALLLYLTPYVAPLKGAAKTWEPRREKKRRLRREREAAERSHDSSDGDKSQNESSKGSVSLLPAVKAAEVVEEGAGYVPPKSHRFNFIADAVDIAAPAVVYIEIQGRHPYRGNRQVPISNGSGFIVSPDGLILTNAHVVANKMLGNQFVKVKLHDERVLDGTVIAVDSVSDLAAVKIEGVSNLPTMRLGKSSHIRPGEWVIAMGSPLALSNTITAGIVSTVNRKSKELGLNKDIEYIQTDAAINFGNSGGPLVNLDGEAIGINTMKVTAGISFAIPADYARTFLEKVQKMETHDTSKSWSGWFGGGSKKIPTPGEPKRGYIGITMLSLTPPLLRDLKSRMADFPEVSHGVLVYRMTIGSPAQQAGMKAGDIITHINGKEVKSANDVYSFVQVKQELNVTIVRGPTAEVTQVKVTPEEMMQ